MQTHILENMIKKARTWLENCSTYQVLYKSLYLHVLYVFSYHVHSAQFGTFTL